MNEIEIWKDVIDFEEYYEVSNNGNVRSKERRYRNKNGRLITKHSKVLKPFGDEYLRVGLKLPNDTKVYKKFIHILVAQAFIPNVDNKPTVNHKDGIKINNFDYNLEWATYEEQIQHAVELGLRDPVIIADKARKANSRPIVGFNRFTSQTMEFDSIEQAREILKLNSGVINYALNNGNETNGWLFEYKV